MTESEGALSYLYEHRWPIVVAFLIFAIAAAVVYYVSPLLDGIVFGVFFAYVTRPIKDYLQKYTRFAPLVATFCILLPVVIIFVVAALEAKNQITWLSQNSGEVPAQIDALLASLNLPPDVVSRLNGVLANLADYLLAFAGTIPVGATFTRLLLFGTNALVSLFVCFYLLKDGDAIGRTAGRLTPGKFRPAVDFFAAEADRLLSGIYIGTFYTALFIAAMSALIMFVFGIPHLVLLTAFVFLAAMVPILSGMMVFLPLTAYLYIDRGPLTAIVFLAVSVVFIYVPPDFVLRPYLINRANRGSSLHPLLIILAFIGGGLAGGLSGFFAAPLVMGLLVAVYRTHLKFGGAADESPAPAPAGP
ncbi:MAG TPA: AI-2E family transporter [Methanocella sp.]|nr:AI-2E family transporter [Methanocella sp.]